MEAQLMMSAVFVVVMPDVPLSVCDKTAGWFIGLERDDIFVTDSTYHYGGGGCC